MICKKCGHDSPEDARYCPKCGKPFSGAVKAGKFFKTLIILVIILAAVAAAFLIGNYIEKTEIGSRIKTPDFIASFTDKIRNVASFPVEIELTQSRINEFLTQNGSSFAPFSELCAAFPSEGGIAFSGMISKSQIGDRFSQVIPDILLMFMPENIPVYAHANLSVGDGKVSADVRTVSVGGITLGSEALNAFGINELIAETIEQAVVSEYDGKIELKSIEFIDSENSGERVMKIGVRYYIAGQKE